MAGTMQHDGHSELRKKLGAHFISIVIVAVVFIVIALLADARRQDRLAANRGLQKYLALENVDFGDPVDRAIFRESLRIFYPGQGGRNDSLMLAIEDFRVRQFTEPEYKSGNTFQGLTWDLSKTIGEMYLQFVGVYVVVLVLIYLAAQRIGVYRFVKMKQREESYVQLGVRSFHEFRITYGTRRNWGALWIALEQFGKAVAKGVLFLMLFSPAYVIAYSLKTTVDTSSLVFMMLLGVVSNGVLINAANRFYTFLVSESNKGYVQTAIVKNLYASYEWDTPDGIPRRALVKIRGAFRSHAFSHVFLNARFQFIPALKEHASFLVTGLIIIEMALNIQGHLCYELLQQVLYRQYDVVCAIIFSIFMTVKATEIAVDIWYSRERSRYGY